LCKANLVLQIQDEDEEFLDDIPFPDDEDFDADKDEDGEQDDENNDNGDDEESGRDSRQSVVVREKVEKHDGGCSTNSTTSPAQAST
jgi:hypothetical protein